LAISNQITERNPVSNDIPNWENVRGVKSKKVAKGWRKMKLAVSIIVTPMIAGTMLFLYTIVVAME
jgi:hypothetical protein